MSREDILLKEYEICQQDSDSSARSFWTTFGIFTGLSTAAIGGAAALSFRGESGLPIEIGLGFILISGIMVIIVLCFLQKWLTRVNHFIGTNNRRMREIEAELGMEKNIRIWILDHWDELRNLENEGKLEMLVISDKKIKEYMRTVGKTFEFVSGEDMKKLENLEIPIPPQYHPPKTGSKIITGLFEPLLAFWGVFILLVAGILISRVLN